MTESFADIRFTSVPVWRWVPPGTIPPSPRLELYALRETPEIALALKVMAERRITVVLVPNEPVPRGTRNEPLFVNVELRNVKQERFRYVDDVPNVDREVNESIRVLLTDLGAIYKELVS